MLPSSFPSPPSLPSPCVHLWLQETTFWTDLMRRVVRSTAVPSFPWTFCSSRSLRAARATALTLWTCWSWSASFDGEESFWNVATFTKLLAGEFIPRAVEEKCYQNRKCRTLSDWRKQVNEYQLSNRDYSIKQNYLKLSLFVCIEKNYLFYNKERITDYVRDMYFKSIKYFEDFFPSERFWKDYPWTESNWPF